MRLLMPLRRWFLRGSDVPTFPTENVIAAGPITTAPFEARSKPKAPS